MVYFHIKKAVVYRWIWTGKDVTTHHPENFSPDCRLGPSGSFEYRIECGDLQHETQRIPFYHRSIPQFLEGKEGALKNQCYSHTPKLDEPIPADILGAIFPLHYSYSSIIIDSTEDVGWARPVHSNTG
jgi:hypothetical protein